MVRTLSPERRQSFLNAALQLFVAQGVQNTSTAAIARAAGSAAGTLFLYFPTKQELIDSLLLELARQQSAYIRSLLDPALSARETFFAIWSGSLRWFLDHPDAYRYVQQTRDTHLVGDTVFQESARYFAYYYQAIERGLAEGAIQPYPIELIGAFLYQGIIAVMNLLTAQPDPARQEELIRLGFEIFWNGIQIKQPLNPAD